MTNASPDRQIVAMGGGGFSEEPDNLALDRYVLGLVRRDEPRVCFVPTASGDAKSYLDRFYAAFATLRCVPKHLSLFDPPATDLRSFVLGQDIIYVGGGSTRNMLVLWREWGLDLMLREAWERGIVLAGVSAGAICWFEEGVTDSVVPGGLAAMRCLGFLPGTNCPHYDAEPERRPAFHRLLADGLVGDGYACDDGVALHYVGDRLARVVSSRPQARAYRLRRRDGEIEEQPLEPIFLGAPSGLAP